MKQLISAIFFFLAVAVFSQSPSKINYQGIARNASGQVITSGSIGLKFEIIDNASVLSYSETNSAPVNSVSGVFNTTIGSGSSSMVLSNVSWTNGPYTLKIYADPNGGSSYSIIGQQQLVSVPYALYAEKVPLNISGAGSTTVSGSFPNYTVNTPISSAQSPTIIGVLPIVVSQSPSVGTPTAYYISSSTASTSTGISITGTGNVSVTPNSISSSTFLINVPNPNISYNSSTGVLNYQTVTGNNGVTITPVVSLNGSTLTVGPFTNSVNLSGAGGPWTQSGGTVTLVSNTNNVAIGTSTTNSKLNVYDAVGPGSAIFGWNGNPGFFSGGHGVYGKTASTHSLSSGVLGENVGNGAGVYGVSGIGSGVFGISNNGPSIFGFKGTSNANMGRFARANMVLGASDGVFIIDSTKAFALNVVNKIADTSYYAAMMDGGLVVKAKMSFQYVLKTLNKSNNSILDVMENGKVGINNGFPVASLDIFGNVKIKDGFEGDGRMLVSDPSGLAKWKSSPSAVVFGNLNAGSTTVTAAGTQIPAGTMNFTKQTAQSEVEVFLYTRAFSGVFIGASQIIYEIRIDGNSTAVTTEHRTFVSGTTEYITVNAHFTGLGPGLHSIQIWAKTDAGSSGNVLLDPSGYGGKVIVKENY